MCVAGRRLLMLWSSVGSSSKSGDEEGGEDQVALAVNVAVAG